MYNLISIGQLDDKSHNMTYIGYAWKVTKEAILAWENKTRTFIWPLAIGVRAQVWLIKLIKEKKKKVLLFF